ncbi:WRKY transcription factor 20 isoform X1 [Populus alba x Populus x berolinensis]|nr:WRKY transcription factor 20 isoform X1 [Populus alba x Populus x berolinensis]
MDNINSRSEVPDGGDPPRLDTCGGGARYKLMSPAKLPISRSACIMISPGLSPTSFLESPVLLSNVKAEPSPTTGTFTNPQTVLGSRSSTSYSATTVSSTTFGERKSNCFEFRPHARSDMVSADMNHQRSAQCVEVQSQCQSQSFPSSPSVKGEMAVCTNELTLSTPLHMVTSGSSVPAEIDSDELNQMGLSSSGLRASQSDHKTGSAPTVSSDDGYNWRKYGQKHVKGRIIYKGIHDHPKPQPSRRYASGSSLFMQEERFDKFSSLPSQDDKSPGAYGQVSHAIEPDGAPELSPGTTNDDTGEGAEDDKDPFSKRRRLDAGGFDVTPVIKPIREPRVVVQTQSEVDILDDGYRWRKYGQKVVRGNPNPRSYYKCTNAGCPVRKHVERASHDPKAVITTYEGKHNHDVPTARTNSHDTAGPSAVNGTSRTRPDKNETVSLDLGVGISSTSENWSSDQQQALHAELVGFENQASGSSFRIVHASPIAPCYGVLNGGMIQFITGEGRSIEIPPLNHSSYPYPQNVGSLLTGP